MTESREFCESCQRWLEHDQRFCPLFPKVRAVRRGTILAKWAKCMCLVHTCYEAPVLRHRSDAPTYRDF